MNAAPLSTATPAQRAALLSYQRRIRNAAKRAYALRYLEIGEAADYGREREGLSFMGAQSVRLSVAAILRGEGN